MPHRAYVPANIPWEDPPPPRANAGPPFRGLQARDLDLIRLVAEARYLFIEHAAMAGFTNYVVAARRLRQLMLFGWLQRARLVPPRAMGRTVQLAYSITDQGVAWLRAFDPDWDEDHEGFEAPGGKILALDKVWHELLRNTAVQRLTQALIAQHRDVLWRHGAAATIRGYPYGRSGNRLAFTPDAVIWAERQVWLVELERSWRTTILVKKSQQYNAYFEYQLWQQHFATAPRVLFVLTPQSTQTASLQRWMQSADLLRTPHALMAQLPALDQPEILLSHWDPDRPARLLTERWGDLNTP